MQAVRRDERREAGRTAWAVVLVALLLVAVVGSLARWLLRTGAPSLQPRAIASGPGAPAAAPLPPAAAERSASAPVRTPPAGAPAGTAAGVERPRVVQRPDFDAAPLLGARRGRVLDAETRRPLIGAVIARVVPESSAAHESWWRFEAALTRATTDALGRFEIADVRVDEPLWIGIDQYPWTRIELARLEPGDAGSELLLSRGGRVRARVSAAAGAPVADARVVIRSELLVEMEPSGGQSTVVLARFEFAARTGGDGEAWLARLPAYRQLDASLDRASVPLGSVPTADGLPLRLAPGQEVVREWRLGGGVTLRGHVVDERGQPLAGALLWIAREAGSVELAADGTQRFRVGDEALAAAACFADDDSRFEFPPLPPGRYAVGPAPWSRMGVGKADHDLVPIATPIELFEGRVDQEIELRAVRGLFLAGRVVGRRGEPVRADLLATAANDCANGISNDDGWFRIGPLTDAAWTLRVEPQDARFARLNAGPFAAGSRDLEIVVPAAARLDVACNGPDGAPAVARLVVVQQDGDRIAWLDGAGRGAGHDDVFDGLPAGSYAVGATTEDGLAGVVADIVLAEGESRRVELPLARAGRVELRAPGGGSERMVVSCSNGAVVVAIVELAGGEQATVALPLGRNTVRATIDGKPWGREVEVAAGETVAIELGSGR